MGVCAKALKISEPGGVDGLALGSFSFYVFRDLPEIGFAEFICQYFLPAFLHLYVHRSVLNNEGRRYVGIEFDVWGTKSVSGFLFIVYCP